MGAFDDLIPKKPKPVGTGEYLGRKFTQGALNSAAAANIVLGGVASALGFNEFGDRRFDDSVGMRKAANDVEIGVGTNDALQGGGERVAGAVVNALPNLATMVVSPALGVVQSGIGSLSDAADNLDAGLSMGATAKNFAVDNVGNVAGIYLPAGMGKSLKTVLPSGVALNVAQGAATDEIKNRITASENAELAKKYDAGNIEARVVDALLGGAGGYGHLRGQIANQKATKRRGDISRYEQSRNFDNFNSQVAPYQIEVDAANAQAKTMAEDVVRQSTVQPEVSGIADIISQVTGAPRQPETPQDAIRAAIQEDSARKAMQGELNQGELARQIRLYGDELPPQYETAPASQEQAVRMAYEAQGIDPESIAMAFNRGRTVDEANLPQAQRDITQKENSQAFAKRAFDIADLRQRRADGDLADYGTIAPDYQGGLAAYSGGTVNGNERSVYMVGENSFEPLRDGRTGEPIRDAKGNIVGTFTDVDGNKTNGIAKPSNIKVFTSPANPRQAQDFMAQSSQPRAGVGEGTMAQERMPRRSTDRISGDVYGGQATRNLADPYTPEPREPSGAVDVEQAPSRKGLKAPRQTQTVDAEVEPQRALPLRRTDVATVDGQGVRRPYDMTPDTTARVGSNQVGTNGRLPSPDAESPQGKSTGRMVTNRKGETRQERESYQQRNDRVDAERSQQSVADYSRNELGNTARKVGRTDTSAIPRSELLMQKAEVMRETANGLKGKLKDAMLKKAEETEAQATRLMKKETAVVPYANNPRGTQAPKPTVRKEEPPRKYTKSGGELLDSIKKFGGIKSSEAMDTFGENAGGANRYSPNLFRNSGKSMDDIVQHLIETGHLTQRMVDDADANMAGGAQQLVRNLLNDAVNGKETRRLDDNGAEAEYYDKAEREHFDRMESDPEYRAQVEQAYIDEANSMLAAESAWLREQMTDVEYDDAFKNLNNENTNTTQAEATASRRNDTAPDSRVAENSRESQQARNAEERSSDRAAGENVNRPTNGEPVRGDDEPILSKQSRADLEAKDKQAKQPESDKTIADRERDVPFTLSKQSAPEKADTTGEMFTPDGRASKAAETKSDKAIKLEKAADKVYEMNLDSDLTKPKVRNAANKMLKDGIIDELDFKNIESVLKDRGMSAEDALDELRVTIDVLASAEKESSSKPYGGAQFSSNPFFDPEIYKSIARDANTAVKKVSELLSKHFKYGTDDATFLARTAKDFADIFASNSTSSGKKAMGGVVRSLVRNAFEAYGARINSIADRSDSDTFKQTVKRLYSRASDNTGTDLGVEHKVDIEYAKRLNGFTKQIDALQKSIDDKAMPKDSMQQVVNLIRNPKNIRPNGGQVHEAAAAIRKSFDDMLTYMRDAGVEVGEVKDGYYPREYDVPKMLEKPDAFKRALARAYIENGASNKEAMDMAADTFADMTIGSDSFFQGNGAKPRANFIKGRVFGKSVDNTNHPLNEFLINDPRISIPRYINAAVRRAELSRFMRDASDDVINSSKNPSRELSSLLEEAKKDPNRSGESPLNWQIIRQKMLDDNVHPDAVAEFVDFAHTVFGLKGTGKDQNGAASLLRMATTSAMLEKATLSSLGEMFMPAIRSGNILDMHKSVFTTMKSLIMKNSKDTKALTELAEDLGIITSSVNDTVMANRWHGSEANTAQSKNLSNFFRMTGLHQWTDATRLASVRVGQTFVRRMAKQLEAGNGKLSRQALGELGIPPLRAEAFAKWLGSVNDGLPTPADLRTATPEMRELYSRALQKFDYQTIMRPNKATKPKWAQDGFGSLIFQFQSYNYAFYEAVWKRNASKTYEAFAGKDYTMSERLRLAAPLMMMTSLVGAQYLVGELRDALFGDPDRKKTGWDKLITALSRGIPIAPIDPMLNIYSSAKYNSTAAQVSAGAGLGLITKPIDASVRYFQKNSPNTNTNERAMAKSGYDVFIEPAASMLLSAAYGNAPTPVKVGLAATRQVIGSGKVRNEFVDATAGKKIDKKSKKTRDDAYNY